MHHQQFPCSKADQLTIQACAVNLCLHANWINCLLVCDINRLPNGTHSALMDPSSLSSVDASLSRDRVMVSPATANRNSTNSSSISRATGSAWTIAHLPVGHACADTQVKHQQDEEPGVCQWVYTTVSS